MNLKQPKIIFFIDGPVPSEAEKLDAFDLGVPVQFRNAQHVSRIEEECDGVTGHVPEAYKDHPTAEDALKAYKAEVKKARAKLLEVGGKAPKPGESTETGKQSEDGDKKDGQQGAAAGQGDANDGKGGPTPTPTEEDPAKAAAAAAAGAPATPAKGGPAAGGWKQN